MNKFLLIISKNYWGSCVSEKTAIQFLTIFSKILNIQNENITHLMGQKVNVNSVKQTINEFVINSINKSKSEECCLFIYMNGHGGQINDVSGDEALEKDGLVDTYDETYHLPDGHISDDDLTSLINTSISNTTNTFESTNTRPLIFLISDHCSSGSMIDKYTYSNKLLYDWITIGSSRDYQDSYISGDGHIMTKNLLDILESFSSEQLNNISLLDFYSILDSEIKTTFIGELQCLTLRVSNPTLYGIKPFKKN